MRARSDDCSKSRLVLQGDSRAELFIRPQRRPPRIPERSTGECRSRSDRVGKERVGNLGRQDASRLMSGASPPRSKAATLYPRGHAFMARLGVEPTTSPHVILRKLARRHGSAFADALVHAMATDDGETTELVHQSLSITLDTLGFVAIKQCACMEWLAGADLTTPRRLLDVGCGSGVVTCFLSELFPEAEIVGIDRCANAILRAREIAQRLGCTHVRFENIALDDTLAVQALGMFDLITAITAFHEAFPNEILGARGHRPGTANPVPEAPAAFVSLLAVLEVERGELLQIDRFPTRRQLSRWVGILAQSGMKPYPGQTDEVRYTFDHVEQRLPVLRSRRVLHSASAFVDVAGLDSQPSIELELPFPGPSDGS